MLERLKNLDLERMDVDEMVAMSAFAKSLASEYSALALDQPEWLDTKSTELKREIGTRLADLRDKRIRELKARLNTLKSTEEKKSDLTAELARLEAAAKA
jgi:hypothetical protein